MGGQINTSIRKQYLIAACLYLGQMSVGYTMGWTAPVLPKLQNLDESPLDHVLTDGEASWMVSISFIGIITGPFISGYLCNAVGRKPCLYFGGSFFVVTYLIMAVAKSLFWIYVGRTLVGVGTGVIFVTNLVYIGEMASARIRGTLLTLTGLSSTLGILFVYSIGPYISYTAINWIGMGLGVAYMASLLFFVTETAVYKVMKGKREVAMANLESLGRQDDIDEIVARANEKPKSKTAQLTEIFTVKSNRRAAFIILVLCILTQFSGMMVVIAYVTIIFEMTGSKMESHISTIIIGVTQVFASIIAPLLVDRVGRKMLLLVSCKLCSLSLAALGGYFYLYNSGHPAADSLQWVTLVSVMVFCVAYYSGMGIIPNTFIGEMFTDTCRGVGGTITITIGFIFGFGVSTAFGYVLSAWGPTVVFAIFSCCCNIEFFFTIFFVPETKGKSLSEIQALLNR